MSLHFHYRLELGLAAQAGLRSVFGTARSAKRVRLAEAVLPTKGTPRAAALLEPTAPPGAGQAAWQELPRGSGCVSSRLMRIPAQCRPGPALHTCGAQAETTHYWQSRFSLEESLKDQEF